MPQTSFQIEDAEDFLNRLKDFYEVLQEEWSRVLNQWYNLKSSWYDYHIGEFEEIFNRLSSDYLWAIKYCEQCINFLEGKIRVAESVKDLEDCLPFLEGLSFDSINSSEPKITVAQRTAYTQKILKGLSHLPKIFLDKAKAKIKGAYARLSAEAVAALIFYTSQSLGYQQINRLLRGQMTKFADAENKIGWNVAQAKQDYQDHIKFINEALNKLPNYEGIVFRGSKVEQKQLAKYKVGQIITEKGFTSTSSNMAVAQAFSGNVFYTIFSKTGKAIKDFSEFSGEDEVLFRSGTKFKVLAVENKNGKTFIKMMEV